MLTGGCDLPTNSTFLLDLINKSIENCPNLLNGRKSHSMTWIDNSVAVIGGSDRTNKLNSVEIFKNKEWVKGSSINIPRVYHTSITCGKTSWVIGGFAKNELDSIEKYENNEWKLLELKLPTPSFGIGTVCIENYLLLLGGTMNNAPIDNVFYINTNKLEIKEVNKLEYPACFYYNHTFIDSTGCLTLDNSNSTIKCFSLDMASILKDKIFY